MERQEDFECNRLTAGCGAEFYIFEPRCGEVKGERKEGHGRIEDEAAGGEGGGYSVSVAPFRRGTISPRSRYVAMSVNKAMQAHQGRRFYIN